MSQWYLAKDGDVLIHNGKGLTISDRIPYIDIQCPQGFDPEAEGCGKSYGHWSLIDSAMNVWRFECKYSTWHDLFFNNRGYGGDFRHTDGDFRCVGSGNTDLITQMDGLFRDCDGLVSCVTIDTQNCINLSAMFAECRYLTEVPYLNTSSNMDFNNFVVSCERLTKINEDIDTSNGRCFWWMCYGCTELQTVPTIDLRNANDTWQSEFSRRGGNDHMFSYCPSLKYVHLIGGAGISNVSAMFYMQYYALPNKPTKVLTIDWDDCYLPLVTGLGEDGDGSPTAPMFEEYWASSRPAATYYSVSSISLPNIAQNVAGSYVPQAVHLGDINVPNVSTNVRFNNDLESIGTVTLTPSVIGSGYSTFSQMFTGCTKLTEFPNVVMPTISSGASKPSLYEMFSGVTNVGAGSYAFYQDLISKGYGTTEHYHTFYNCGINTPEGAADLAQIPSAWK